jgi:hypothetical protein
MGNFKTNIALSLSVVVSAGLLAETARGSNFYASQVISTVVGTEQPAAFSNPDVTLGGPTGAGDLEGATTNVYKLGNGGSITYGFGPGQVIQNTNGTAADFIVFANPFYLGGDSTEDYAELSYVEVSSDGTHFATFPTLSLTPSAVGAFGTINPVNVSGFAGVTPVYANVTTNPTDPNPFDPTVAGGDAFDLSALDNTPNVLNGSVNLNAITEVRIVDVVSGTSTDSEGNIIYCPGTSGAVVNSIAVIDGATVPEPGTLAILASASGVLLVRRRRGCCEKL